MPAEVDNLSGRRALARNVMYSWSGHAVFVLAGFIIPRVIDRKIGQTALGIWDFGWSIVNYFWLAQAGIGSSVNRHVAKYRAKGESEALNCVVSSVMCVQLLRPLRSCILSRVVRFLKVTTSIDVPASTLFIAKRSD